MTSSYEQYVEKLQKIADVQHAIAVLSWDKEVNLPKGSAAFRSRQVATLSGIAHEMATAESLIQLVNDLKQDDRLNTAQRRNIHQTSISLEKSMKFDTGFVIKKSEIVSRCFHAWAAAKEKNDASAYLKPLSELIDVVREEAEILGYQDHPYDALLDLYEPKLTVNKLDSLFEPLKSSLIEITQKIKASPQVDDSFLRQFYPKNEQWSFGLKVLEQMGYNFDTGRQDISSHPFTISFSPQDVRVTTRVDENDMANMLWSCIHEGGHALYEQGLNPKQYGLPLGTSISLGIHESQSRLWENNVARSLAYWQYHYPKLQSTFESQLKDVDLAQFYAGINKIAPNLIRTEADELHYHFHVIIRYEIEKAILSGDINPNDIKEAWNGKYKSYLGLDVPDDAQGFLQDIHWSHGSIGYFPTYSIGSLYAAQFFNSIENQIEGLQDKIQDGDTSEILDWLRENVHQHGQMYDAEDLCERITGEGLNAEYFLDYVKKKYAEIYQIAF